MPSDETQTNLTETAHQLLTQNSTGTLATFSTKHPGFPFASVASYSVSDAGEPIFFFSSMARHSKNLKNNPKASLLVAAQSGEGGALAAGRITVMGTVKPVEPSDVEAIKEGYLDANPEAAQWASFGDFQFYRLEITESYVVAGFGSMGWVKPE